jgi:hypothetical protein
LDIKGEILDDLEVHPTPAALSAAPSS